MARPNNAEGSDQSSGKQAEDAACEFLRKHGLRLVVRNYRCRQGEIDLVMTESRTLVFVEVRFRRSERYGGALESVDRAKQNRIVTAASHYLAAHAAQGPVRFDVVAMSPDGQGFSVNWVKDAFRLS